MKAFQTNDFMKFQGIFQSQKLLQAQKLFKQTILWNFETQKLSKLLEKSFLWSKSCPISKAFWESKAFQTIDFMKFQVSFELENFPNLLNISTLIKSVQLPSAVICFHFDANFSTNWWKKHRINTFLSFLVLNEE